jgi:hypothetical protein
MAHTQVTAGLFAEPGNRQVQQLQRRIEALAPGAARVFDLSPSAFMAATIADTGVYWDGVNVAQLKTAYIHGFSYANPVIPPALPDTDWSVWQVHDTAQQQSYSFAHSAFGELARRGVTVVNPPAVHVQNFMKVDLLEDLRQAGLRVPELLCTNDADAAQAFAERVGRAVWRPTTGRAAWQLFGDKQREHLFLPDKPPILLAEAVTGPLIRAYVLAGRPALYLKRTPPADVPIPERLEALQAVDRPGLDEPVQRLVQTLGLSWGQVFFVLSEDRPYVYDVDVDPILDWLPDEHREALTDGLARSLLGLEFVKPEVSSEPQARPTLFLRRMLRAVFDLETAKYQGP